ncbi:hypothetical protein WR25_01221 [Diploscapter pachys]|uniref:Protein kinase domain-containing protein n=1 Tax=Diploscapter pachys TaxID=2018661 RepID=A0A2A2KPR5_9BILA|nr:hypothetical protein WR25_01221 [Diploscapter pachys]
MKSTTDNSNMKNGNGVDDSSLIPKKESRQQILSDLIKASKDIVKRPTVTVKFVYGADMSRKTYFLPLKYDDVKRYIRERWPMKKMIIYSPPTKEGKLSWPIRDQKGLDEEIKIPSMCVKCGGSRKSTNRSYSTVQDEENPIDEYAWTDAEQWPVIRILGTGINGDVLLKHTPDGWHVAVKEVVKNDKETNEYDMELLKKLNHRNIVQYFALNYLDDSNRIQIIMEYMPGGTLREFIDTTYEDSTQKNKNYHGLEPFTVGKFLEQILLAVVYLHSSMTDFAIYHGDIKSANILMDGRGNVKLSDFGSCCMGTAPSQQFKGSIPYSAPEVLRRITKPGRLADVWSIGVVLLEMMNGKLPWSIPPFEKFKPIIENPDIYSRFVEVAGWLLETHEKRMYAPDIYDRFASAVNRRSIEDIEEELEAANEARI